MTAQDSDDPDGMACGGEDAELAKASCVVEFVRQKTEDLVALGVRRGHARGLASLEMRIAQWPPAWGDDLCVLIYGDFQAPPVELEFPALGITISPERVENSVVTSAMCVLRARVKVDRPQDPE
jgi:hypothetical protein